MKQIFKITLLNYFIIFILVCIRIISYHIITNSLFKTKKKSFFLSGEIQASVQNSGGNVAVGGVVYNDKTGGEIF